MLVGWMGNGLGRFWLGPVLLGVVLIAMGVVLYVWPDVLAYVVAGVFIIGGISLIGSGWRMRQQVTYRRMDDRQWYVDGDDSPRSGRGSG